MPAQILTPPLLVNITRAAAMVGMTRYQLWCLERKHRGAFPVLRVGKRKRLIDPLRLKAFIEEVFTQPPPAPTARRRGRPRKAAAVAAR